MMTTFRLAKGNIFIATKENVSLYLFYKRTTGYNHVKITRRTINPPIVFENKHSHKL